MGQEEQGEAHDQHAACLLPGTEFHQAGEDGRGEDNAGEQVEDPTGEADHEGQRPLNDQQCQQDRDRPRHFNLAYSLKEIPSLCSH